MESNIQFAAKVVSFLNRNEGRSGYSSWRNWRDCVESIYEVELGKTVVITAINQGKQESGSLPDLTVALAGIKLLTDDNRRKILHLVRLYMHILSRSDVNQSIETRDELWRRIIEVCGIDPSEEQQITAESDKWKSSIEHRQFGTLIQIPATIKVVLIDFLLRWIFLWYSLSDYGPNNFLGIGHVGFLFISQVLIVPGLIIAWAYNRDRKVVSQSMKLLEELKIPNLRLKIRNSAWNYLFICLVFGIGGIATASLTPFGMMPMPGLAVAIFGIIYAIYILVLQKQYSKRVPTVLSVRNQLQEIRQRELDGSLGIDENDEEIVNLEVSLRSAQGKVDSFVIEAALLGALAFTCFLQIIAASDFSLNSITDFNRHLHQFIADKVNLSESTGGLMAFFGSKSAVLSIMCYESILCSVFFLSVIASRLRLGHLTDQIARTIELAKTFNRKEEENMFSDVPEMKERVLRYNLRIKDELRSGYRIQAKIQPILEFMGFFRTLGMLAFFSIVITGGVFLSVEVALILCAVSLLSLVYFRFDRFNNGWRNFYSRLQEFYFPKHKLVAKIAWWAFTALVIIRSIFDFEGLGEIHSLVLLILTGHYLLMTFLPGELAGGRPNAHYGISFTRIMKIIIHTSVAISILSALFKLNHFPGAGPLLLISNLILVFFFLFSPKIINGNKLLGYVLSFSLSIAAAALVFMIQRWPGWPIIQMISVISMGVSVIIIFYRWRDISAFNKRAVALYTFISLNFFFPFIMFSLANLKFDYSKFKDRQNFDKLLYKIHDDFGSFATPAEQDSMVFYINKINEVHHEKISWDVWDGFAYRTFENTTDTNYLREAVAWNDSSIALEANADNHFTRANILFLLGDYDEALVSARFALREGGEETQCRELMTNIYNARSQERKLETDSLLVPTEIASPLDSLLEN